MLFQRAVNITIWIWQYDNKCTANGPSTLVSASLVKRRVHFVAFSKLYFGERNKEVKWWSSQLVTQSSSRNPIFVTQSFLWNEDCLTSQSTKEATKTGDNRTLNQTIHWQKCWENRVHSVAPQVRTCCVILPTAVREFPVRLLGCSRTCFLNV